MTGQPDFAQALLDPARPAPAGLTNPDGAPVRKRFDVYRNNVAVSLTEALETAFPVIRKLVGAGNFRTVASVYVRRHPPRSPLMMFYGADMPGFLEGFEPIRALAYLPDVARLELALRESYHAADAAPLDQAALQETPPERLMAARLRLAPALRLIRSRHPVHAIWRYNMEDGAPKPQPGGQNVLVTRPEFDPMPVALPPGGGTFAAALLTGESFGAAVEAAQTATPEFDLTAVLGLLLEGGAIIALDEG